MIEEKIRKKLKVAISHGDYNGISYEVIIKAFADNRMVELFTPVVYGSSKLASYYSKLLNRGNIHFNLIKSAAQAVDKRLNIVNVYHDEAKVELGTSTPLAGKLAFQALEQATADLLVGKVDVLVTAPINKDNIQTEGFAFPGHTEYLAKKFNSSGELMIMISSNLRVAVATGHMPLQDVASNMNKTLIVKKLRILNDSLKRDFGIHKPRVAVLGLNPHAGDNGLLGSEEKDHIIPAIKQMQNDGNLCYGPFSADGFFAGSNYTKFDAILAMYHDQGLIPFKVLSFDEGVNFTAGLPIIRTSPGHGTAYDIAGKDLAKPDSLRAALYAAVDIYHQRKAYDEAHANPLGFKRKDNGKDESVDDLPGSEANRDV